MSENRQFKLEQTFDEIDYHIQNMDERGQFPNVWINMIYLFGCIDENYSHIRKYWNHPIFDKEYWEKPLEQQGHKSLKKSK
tara:strand:- start:503 stop:745 length:243 start_codon:yes stop_codon:yes gene_type:complete